MSIKNRFIVSLTMALPILIAMVLPVEHLQWWPVTELALTTVIMVISAGPFTQSAWFAIKHHHANMDTLVAIGTLIPYLYSIYGLLTGRAVYFESVALIVTFMLLGQYMEERMRQSSNAAVQKLLDLQPHTAMVKRNGEFQSIDLDQIQHGETILVKPGERIPLDGEVLTGMTSIDESMVTGESLPVVRKVGDQVIGGTINLDGAIEFRVTHEVDETVLAKITDAVSHAQVSRVSIQSLVDKMTNVFVPVVLITAIVTFVIWFVLLNASASAALVFGVSVIVIACPCALGIATPTALMIGTRKSASLGILIKNGDALENLNQVQTVVFDKTGTLTNGHPVVTDVIGDRDQVLSLAASLETLSEHPIAAAVVNAADLLPKAKVADFKSLVGDGVMGQVDDSHVFVGRPAVETEEIKQLEAQGKTVLVVSVNDHQIGVIAVQDQLKDDAVSMVQELQHRGKTAVIMSGDNQATTAMIADQLGITKFFAGLTPNQKTDKLQELQADGPIAFVGDGINDAPSLATADVGIAMSSGTDIAVESGDIVLMRNHLMDVSAAFDLSGKILNKIKVNLFWSLIYNLVGIPLAAGVFVGIGLQLSPAFAGLAMSLSSISVVLSSLSLNRVQLRGRAADATR